MSSHRQGLDSIRMDQSSIDHSTASTAQYIVEEGLVRAVEVNSLLRASAQDVWRAGETIGRAMVARKLLIVFGNGGSAADAEHIVAEFVGRFREDRPPLPAVALSSNDSVVTAIANDFGFHEVFKRQVQALSPFAGVVVAISTSGHSPNVIAGVQAAKVLRLPVIALTGGTVGNPIAQEADIVIRIPTDDTPRVQEAHTVVLHLLVEIAETIYRQAHATVHAEAPKVVTFDQLLTLRDTWRKRGLKVVWTNGCFDILHAGHVYSLRKAKELGDVLVVGLNDDESVRAQKGDGRPFVSSDDRARVMSELESVDHVVIFAEPTPASILARLQPDIHCKGAEYGHPRNLPESEVVERYGGQVVLLEHLDGRSTTALAARISKSVSDGPNT